MRNLVTRPDLPASLVAAAALQPLFAEHDQLREQAIGLQRAIDGLPRERREAADKDRSAGAAAIRRGSADPGDKASKAVEERAATLERRLAHLRLAMQDIVRDIERKLETDGATWAADAAMRAAEARDELAGAFAAYRAAWEAVGTFEVAARWLRTAGAAKSAPRILDVPLKTPAGVSYSLTTVLAALDGLEREEAVVEAVA